MDDLELLAGSAEAEVAQSDNKSSIRAEDGDLPTTAEGVFIPFKLLMQLFAHKEATKSGKELKAFITVPRGTLKVGEKPLNALRLNIGAFLKP